MTWQAHLKPCWLAVQTAVHCAIPARKNLENFCKEEMQSVPSRNIGISNSCVAFLGPSCGKPPPGAGACSQTSPGESFSVWSRHREPVFRGLGRACGFDAEAKCFGIEYFNWVVLKKKKIIEGE